MGEFNIRSNLHQGGGMVGVAQTRLAVIDDNEDIVNVLVAFFRYQGYHVTGMVGLSSIQPLVEAQPDLVFLDLTMPQLSGEEILRQMGQTPPLDQVPVVVVTSLTHRGSIPGAKAIVAKPFNLYELLDLARNTAQKEGMCLE